MSTVSRRGAAELPEGSSPWQAAEFDSRRSSFFDMPQTGGSITWTPNGLAEPKNVANDQMRAMRGCVIRNNQP